MADNLWVDKVGRVSSGKKRHVYEQESSGRFRRKCGATNHLNESLPAAKRGELTRLDALEYARDPNSCLRCLACEGLEEVAENVSSGTQAASVDYDPFGVFDGE